jgi:D-3-phosphoglycerate dehydrogenase / 2-oxoglutarate reductase
MPDVLITENIIGAAMDELRGRFDCVFAPDLWQEPDRLRSMIPEFRALIARNQTRITRELIEAGARLEVIGRAGVGMDNVDLAAANERGIVVAYTPEQNSNSVAELALGFMLALARMIPASDRDTRKGGWSRQRFMGVEILGKTLGVIGFGRIGSCTAAKARALGMEVIAYDPYVDPEGLKAQQLRVRLTDFAEVLQRSDFITLHVPETAETLRMFSYEQFQQMKPSAFFINTARGGVVDEDGLLRALREKRIAGAALDVRQQEPALPSPLAEMENVIVMPHVGANTHESQRRVVTAICRDIAVVLNGGEAQNFVNFSRPRRT